MQVKTKTTSKTKVLITGVHFSSSGDVVFLDCIARYNRPDGGYVTQVSLKDVISSPELLVLIEKQRQVMLETGVEEQ